MYKYQKSIDLNNMDTLEYSLKKSILKQKWNSFTKKGNKTVFIFEEALSPEESEELNVLINQFPDDMAISQVKEALMKAKKFGNSLIDDFISENMLLGIIQSGLSAQVRLASKEIVDCLQIGSLYEAIQAIDTIPENLKDDTFLTNSRLLEYKNKIEAYLKLPLSQV